MSIKYRLLEQTLDKILSEAPAHLAPKITNDEQICEARGRALIHLYLRTSFGLLDYAKTEEYITEGTHDGGLDAYYINYDNKKIYLIQSKYRATDKNFESRPVDGYELFKMDLDRIVKGLQVNTAGKRYNKKIISFQTKLQEIASIGKYKYALIFIGNLPQNLAPDRLNQVTGHVCDTVEIVNGDTVYMDLLLPFLQSDFYNQEEFTLKINVKQDQSNRIKYKVKIHENNVNIDLCFIPTAEIAKMMLTYKNSLLKHNPRCYTGIRRGGVNKKIEASISETDSNEFSLLNNGITIICTNFEYSENNAIPDTATIIISNPQIVNGGQTAFTLAKLLEFDSSIEKFNSKEVLVKFISISDVSKPAQIDLIEKISEATNNQTSVELSDRISNDDLLVDLQTSLFNNYGILLERKRGEFYDSIQNKIIDKENILGKDRFMRLLLCYQGKAAEARNYSSKKLFEVYPLKDLNANEHKIIPTLVELDNKLNQLKNKSIKISESNFAQAIEAVDLDLNLRYGKYAVLTAVLHVIRNDSDIGMDAAIKFTLDNWEGFKILITNKQENSKYKDEGFNFDNYYKGSTVNTDLREYFFNEH